MSRQLALSLVRASQQTEVARLKALLAESSRALRALGFSVTVTMAAGRKANRRAKRGGRPSDEYDAYDSADGSAEMDAVELAAGDAYDGEIVRDESDYGADAEEFDAEPAGEDSVLSADLSRTRDESVTGPSAADFSRTR